MKRVFISQPMRGLTAEEITSRRAALIKAIRRDFGEIEIIDSHFKEAPAEWQRLDFLGESIKLLGKADLVVFAGDWASFDGCNVEHFVAQRYDIPCDYYVEECPCGCTAGMKGSKQ
ncbi:MAG: hypothetical protein LBM75_07180 [Myxococcales bacterium]|jgi:hypothetical protein|nr:hypothetical protein [Myxococcales bacterium]